MSRRIQVIVAEREREAFRREARRCGLSLSAWLRLAGMQQLRAAQRQAAPRSPAELEAFFEACDAHEVGVEPDWTEHLRVIGASQRSGNPTGGGAVPP